MQNDRSPVTVRWQWSRDGGQTWQGTLFRVTDDLFIDNTTLSDSGTMYRAVDSVPGATRTTTPATLTVVDAPAPPAPDNGGTNGGGTTGGTTLNSLARAGSSLDFTWAYGLALVAFGLLAVTRRRRRTAE